MTNASDTPIYQQPAEILRSLIRFDTTNPPGNERECALYIKELFDDAGFETTLLGKVDSRPNLITRLAGRGDAPPLLLYGHMDVVTTEGQQWTHPPFEAKVIDDVIWGRGAMDMKGGLAMYIAALLRAKAEGFVPAGDIIFAALCDEEAGGDYGAKFLAEEHPEQLEGVRHALGEFGGSSMWMGDKKLYPIQIGEKQVCWMKATIRGQGGHGSMPVQGQAMAKLGKLLTKLDRKRLPLRITPPVRTMFEAMAEALGTPIAPLLHGLMNPMLSRPILSAMGDRGRLFGPLLRNTVSPTIVHASTKVNVIPADVALELDGRLLPGLTPDDMMADLAPIVGDDIEIQITRFEPGPSEVDLGLMDMLRSVLVEADPEALVVPLVLPGCTDAHALSQLGIHSYGFTPMQLPKEFSLIAAAHAADERVPISAIEFGARTTYRAIQMYGA